MYERFSQCATSEIEPEMFDDLDDSIVAIATPPGSAPRAIIRVSGRSLATKLTRIFNLPSGLLTSHKRPRIHLLQLWIDGVDRNIGLELAFWPNQRSYTRQPMAEIHCIGSPPIVQSILRTLNGAGIRLARPGEFTLRAFLAGRIDLAQAGAVLGVIDAQSTSEMNVALRQMAGGLAGGLHQTQEDLLNLLADVEAGLDFVEEDIEFVSDEQLAARLHQALSDVGGCTRQLKNRDSFQADFRVVIFGSPNVGKSSLFNRLVDAESSNVDAAAGTTRDFNIRELKLESAEHLLVNICMIDTAGVDQVESSESELNFDSIESRAQQQSAQQIQDSHLRLFCLDGSRELNAWEEGVLGVRDPRRLIVVNKIDLPLARGLEFNAHQPHWVCCLSNQGIDKLKRHLATIISEDIDSLQGHAFINSQCVSSLIEARVALNRAFTAASANSGHEIVAAEIREAVDAIGVVTGAVYTEDLLGRIFNRFCIGK